MAHAFRSTRVMTPQGAAAATLVVEQGRIASVREWGDVPPDTPLRDLGDMVILPGLVDTHVHINETGRSEWEGFRTATRAAAAGGVTTLVDMPLNCVPETIDVKSLEVKRASARGKTWVDWATWGGVVRGNSTELKPMTEAGVPGFKCFLIHSGIDGFAWVDEPELRLALEQLRGIAGAGPLLAHAEVAGPVDRATQVLNASNADWRKYSTYLASRPDEAELEAIALLIRLAEEFTVPVHIVHLASAQALPMLAEARRRGAPVTVETCTHYLWFEADEVPDGATQYKCAPPIRSAENREQLWKALEAGWIDMIATDHSPCPPEMKHLVEGRWDKAWGGIASLGLALTVVWTGMAQRDLGLERIGEWMSAAPARLAGLASQKGALAAGCDADLVVFDPNAEWSVGPEDLYFRHKLSPYLGAKLQGRVLETWLRGNCVFREGEFIAEPHGRELVRQ